MNEYGTTEAPDTPGFLMLGVYHDDYLKTDRGWLFQRRRFSPLYMGPADMSGRSLPFPNDI